jgi:Nucleotide-diphospho-sugar transferase
LTFRICPIIPFSALSNSAVPSASSCPRSQLSRVQLKRTCTHFVLMIFNRLYRGVYFAVPIFTVVILLSHYFGVQNFFSSQEYNPLEIVCPETGKRSAAPNNHIALSAAIEEAVHRIRSRNSNAVIVSTTVNKKAAEENLPHFLESLTLVKPPLSNDTIIFCLDEWACSKCSELHVDPELCLFMNLEVSEESLAPSSDLIGASYWKLTYGRVFATLRIHSEGVSVLPVDVDAVFLINPFSLSEEISEKPDSIAGVIDTRPFELSIDDKSALLNGGFLYFPSTNTRSAIATSKVLQNIWKKSCHGGNEQFVTSQVLKELYNSTTSSDPRRPRILSHEKYLSFCSKPCGWEGFSEITSIEDLHSLEKKMLNKPEFKLCSKENRKKWVYFHAACTTWPQGQSMNLSRAKGHVQKAILQWVQESREDREIAVGNETAVRSNVSVGRR